MMGPQAVLISNPNSKHGELVNTIKTRIQGYLDSIKYQLINYNVARANLPVGGRTCRATSRGGR